MLVKLNFRHCDHLELFVKTRIKSFSSYQGIRSKLEINQKNVSIDSTTANVVDIKILNNFSKIGVDDVGEECVEHGLVLSVIESVISVSPSHDQCHPPLSVSAWKASSGSLSCDTVLHHCSAQPGLVSSTVSKSSLQHTLTTQLIDSCYHINIITY